MKKIKAIILLGVILITISSCGNTANNSEIDNAGTENDMVEGTVFDENTRGESAAEDDHKDDSMANDSSLTEGSSVFLSKMDDPMLKKYFDGYKKAAFVISDGENEKIYNEEFANSRAYPFSTFKIPNSIIGLETGAITKEANEKKWDGTINSRDVINRDLDLAAAYEHSAVWYYQILAKDIGEDKMAEYLDIMSYGNQDISGGIEKFWLGTSLKISPMEQMEFLRAFYNNEFKLSESTVDYVKTIMRYKETSLQLYGKTGSSGNGMAWFVGYIMVEDSPYYFASYVEDDLSGPELRDHLIEMFSEATAE